MLYIFILSIVKVVDINHIATISGTGEVTKSSFSKVAASEIIQIIFDYGPNKVSDDAFTLCTSLEIINISLSIPDIPSESLITCSKTIAIQVPENHLTLSCDFQGALYDKYKTKIIHVPRNLYEFVIPDSVETVSAASFRNCRLKQLHFPSNISFIDSQAFNEASIAEGITFSLGINDLTLNSRSFQYSYIPTVHIPASCVSILSEAFLATKIQTLVFDDYNSSKLKTLGNLCFAQFFGKSIILPQKVTKIPQKCFENSPFLEEVFVPRDCTQIEMNAFGGCTVLSRIRIDSENKNFKDISGLIYDKSVKQLYFIPPTFSNITFPATLEQIGSTVLQSCPLLATIDLSNNSRFNFDNGVLYDDQNLTVIGICGSFNSANILDNAKTIRASAFASSAITKIVFSSNSQLNTIKSKAFEKCLSLTRIELPKLLQSIEGSTFAQCTKLTEVIFDPDCPLSSIPSNCFSTSGIIKLTLPRNVEKLDYRCFYSCFSLETLELLEGNSLYQIMYQAFLECKQLKTIKKPTALSSISELAFSHCSLLVFPFEDAKNLSQIMSKAFSGCGNDNIVFEPSLTQLSENSFENNYNLKTVTFSSLTSLSGSIFLNCINLQKVIISDSIEDLEYSTFIGCSSLTEIDCSGSDHLENFGGLVYKKGLERLLLCPPGRSKAQVSKNTTDIKESAFRGCSKLSEVVFDSPSDLVEIKPYTFNGCNSLSHIILPPGISILGENSFSDCTSLKDLPFESKCRTTSLPPFCFSNTGIVILKLPSEITKVSSDSFSGCLELKEIVISSAIQSLEERTFTNCPLIHSVKFCGKSNPCKGDVFVNPNIIVDVNIYYNSALFGSNLVRRSLDPFCSTITPNKISESSTMLLFANVITQEEESRELSTREVNY